MVVTPRASSRCISCALCMSAPRLRMGWPSSSASSTISTARSTPKQNPYSSAKRTSILCLLPFRLLAYASDAAAGCLSCATAAAPTRRATPLFAQPVAARHTRVYPFDLLLHQPAHAAQKVLLQLAEPVRHILRQHRVRRVAQITQSIADRVARAVVG